MLQRISICPHQVLNYSKSRANHNQSTNCVQYVQALLLRYIGVIRFGRWIAKSCLSKRVNYQHLRQGAESYPKDHSGDSEQSKHNNLDEQPTYYHRLPDISHAILDHQTRRAALNHEGQHVARHEDLRQLADSNQRMLFSLHSSNDLAKRHVYRSCKECGRYEDETFWMMYGISLPVLLCADARAQ